MTSLRRGPAFALAAAVAGALLLRVWHMVGRPLWLDESWSRWMTELSWPGLWDAAVNYDTHPPFYYALLKAWTALAPSTPAGLRSLSLLAGMALLALAWAAAGRIETLRASLWGRALAAASVALSPPLVVGAAQARPYSLFALAFALALWAALGLARSGEAAEERRARTATWLAYLAGLEASLWLHSLGALFAASLAGGLLLALASAGSLRRNLLPYAAVHCAAAIAWLPAFLILLEQRGHWSASSWLHFSFADVPSGLANGLAVPGAGAILVLLLAGLGARNLLRGPAGRPAGLLLLCAALLPAAGAILVSVLAAPVFLPRTLAPSVLPFLLLTAAGLVSLGRPRLFGAASALVLALFGFVSGAQASAPPEEKWHSLSAWLGHRVRPGEELWLLPNEIALPFRYSAGRVPYKVRGIPAEFPARDHVGPRPSGTRAVAAMTQADADRLVADARRRGVKGIWLINRFEWLFDPDGSLPRAFGPRNRDLRAAGFAPLIVEHYRLDPD